MNEKESKELRMFDSHMDIISPGELPRPLKISGIMKDDYIPETRNKILVEVLGKLEIMDKRGTGFMRTREALDNKMPHPEFEGRQGWFIIRFVNPLVHNSDYGILTSREYQKLNKVPNKTAYKELSDIITKQIIEKRGAGKYVYPTLKVMKR